MNPAIERLTKVLRLEARRGFDNRAILGGLERMLEPWEAEAERADVPQAIVQLVESRLRDYPRLSPKAREDALRGIWRRLESELPALGPWSGTAAAIGVAGEAPAPAPEADQLPSADDAAASAPAVGMEASTLADASSSQTADHPTAAVPQEAAPPPPPSAPAPATTRPGPRGAEPAFDAPLTAVSGIGPKSAKTLERLGLYTLGDLLWHLPRRYDDYSQMRPINRLWYGEEVTVIGAVEEIRLRPVRSGHLKLVEALISDGTGALRVTWFNQPWLAERLEPGSGVVLSGKVEQYLGRLIMNNPEWEPLERQQLHTNRIVPVYPLTAGVSGKWLRRVIHSIVGRLAPRVPDPLPADLLSGLDMPSLAVALQQVHFPDSQESMLRAQRRLAFDEMFFLQLGVMLQKRDWSELTTEGLPVSEEWMGGFESHLPFPLTKAQKVSLEEVRSDLATTRPMNRLLQGDVGSGKTVIAAACLAIAAENGAQSAIMAPTSILAEQHWRTLKQIFQATTTLPESALRLLIGATSEAEKGDVRQGLLDGTIRVLVGTHALLEDPILFQRLRMVVIDEQHRFGVEQRKLLREKGGNPHLLVMTATPIPRSLALTLYGDLDLTVLDEMPPGRLSVETRVLRPVERSRAYGFIRSQLDEGRQAFIIYPLVESSEAVDAKAAVDEHQRLQDEVFTGYRVGLLHGRMRAEEKEDVMGQFYRGELSVLVSTSVVEVGIDVTNAAVMLIEGANRFGLAQLHQFRGRVGRGPHHSYCLLIPERDEDTSNERLQAMESTNDGFRLAELDLEQRGPGDFLGTRQWGFAELRLARLSDIRLIEKARQAAQQISSADPHLMLPEHAQLNKAVARFWSPKKGEMS